MSPLTAYVVQTLVTLLAVSALAVVTLYGARRLGFGRPLGPIALVGRLPLDGRRTVYLVRVGETLLVVGASEAGLTRLAELPTTDVALPEAESVPPFANVLARTLGRSRAAGPAEPQATPEDRADT